MGIQGNDLALLTARFGCARFGASRFGFVPCPEDVRGADSDEPGEYIWREETPPSQEVPTPWELVSEDCVCRNLCTLALADLAVSESPRAGVEFGFTANLSGVLGEVGGVVTVAWGDGQHDKTTETTLANGELSFTHTYREAGSYTITLKAHDERGCTVTGTLEVTAGALDPLAGDFEAVASGALDVDSGTLTLTPSITGGSGSYGYAWSAWTEYGGSEGSPAFTDTDEVGLWTPLYDIAASGICSGNAKLIVTDLETMEQLVIGPKSWDWWCV